jgi:hypothetical protein
MRFLLLALCFSRRPPARKPVFFYTPRASRDANNANWLQMKTIGMTIMMRFS